MTPQRLLGFSPTSFFALLLATSLLEGSSLPQEVYVWQRAWTEPVRRAVAEHGPTFARIVVLNGEVTWQLDQPRLVRVSVDYQALAQTRRPISLALRVGPYSGSFANTNAAAVYLGSLAQKLLAEAKAGGVNPSELQLDFDCSDSKLEGYRAWLELIRKRIAPVPLVITALPSWLDKAAFKPLVLAADGYVLQVHSLERPRSFDLPFTLCDPLAARRAVAKAADIGVPFRVALPTYGYIVAFDHDGRFVGLSAEGPARTWPGGAQLKEVRADPLQMAELSQGWLTNPPAPLKGILWYRLPVPGDILNWRWPTLGAILELQVPRKSVRVNSRRVEPGLTEICLVNDGELDISSRLAVQTRWNDARLIAGDGLRGFEFVGQGASLARFEVRADSYRLPAGDTQVIGWIRLTEDREVQVELEGN